MFFILQEGFGKNLRKSCLGREFSQFSDLICEENRVCSCLIGVAKLTSWPRRRLFHQSPAARKVIKRKVP